MIVVSDTSPLNYLLMIEAVEILPRLFHEIYVPPGVMLELQHPKTPEGVKRWTQSPPEWLRVSAPREAFVPVGLLDPGEAEALALAKELGASAVLMDERKGRRIAKEQGFTTLGTLTVIELAAQRGLLELNAALTALKGTSFHLTDKLIQDALGRAAAQEGTGG